MRWSLFGGLFALVLSLSTVHAAQLGIPAQDGTHSGIGVISGWKCEANGDLTIRFNRGDPVPLLHGSQRPDVLNAGACDHANVGYVAIWNWGEMGDGRHTAVVYDDGVEFDRATFTVVTTGEGFLRGAEGECAIADFPAPNEWSRFAWTQSTQHLELVEVQSGQAPTCEPETITETVYRPEVIDGVCYTWGTINACRAGVYAPSTEDESSLFVYWECQGLNGGTTAECFTDKPEETESIDGWCHEHINGCRAGNYAPDLVAGDLPWIVAWECRGLFGGFTAYCRAERPDGVRPECGPVPDSCSKGLWVNRGDPDGYHAWACRGYNGYDDVEALCSIPK